MSTDATNVSSEEVIVKLQKGEDVTKEELLQFIDSYNPENEEMKSVTTIIKSNEKYKNQLLSLKAEKEDTN